MIEDSARIYVNDMETNDPAITKCFNEFRYVSRRCRVNHGGYWEFNHNTYEGNFDDLPSKKMNRIFMIINKINEQIKIKKDDEQ